MTIFICPDASSSPCHWGRIALICSYSSTQMRRLIQTIIALPSIASSRCSKWFTRSCAMSFNRFSEPTSASNGMNHSRLAVSVPTRAVTPSEITQTSLNANSDGICCL
jgi:hypothetical protein